MAGLIVFEGPDNVGKTTIAKHAADTLQRMGLDCLYTSFPGREEGSLGAHVYALHHDSLQYGITSIAASSLQLMHVAAHLDEIEKRILPALEEGTTVLLDRYWWSSWVYGITAGAHQRQLELMLEIEHLAWKNIKPAVLFLLRRPSAQVTTELLQQYDEFLTQETGNYPIVTLLNDGTLGTAVQTAVTSILEGIAN